MSEPVIKLLMNHGENRAGGFLFFCPGCKNAHSFSVGRGEVRDGIVVYPQGGKQEWGFDGNMEKPTFTPSLLRYAHTGSPQCHLFLKNGILEFLSDCQHELAGKSVPLEPVSRTGWCD